MQSTDFADKGTIQDRPCRRGILPGGEKGMMTRGFGNKKTVAAGNETG